LKILFIKIPPILCAAVFIGFCTPVNAAVKLARLFGDHTVLQRDTAIPVWGTADPGEQVHVVIGNDQATVTADAQGQWMVKLSQRPASAQPAELVLTGKNKITIHDVLVGDVWLASGQSNMEMAFFWTEQGKAAAKTVDSPLIRIFKVQAGPKDTPQTTLERGGWTVCIPKNGVVNLTQLGYYFARELQQKLGIPIGIIDSSCSGTSIEAWMSAEAIAADPAAPAIQEHWQKHLAEYPTKKAKYDEAKAAWAAAKAAAQAEGKPFKKQSPWPPSGPGSTQAPAGLYNSMIHPLVPYALRGIIWYQGENNTKRPELYRTLFPSLIKCWRTVLAQNELPFYWVQLPNYNMGTEFGDDWAGVREAQAMTLAVPNTGQAVTIDIGEGNNVHPSNKPEVARRLALIAFVRTYGDQTVIDSGPVFDHAEFRGGAPVRIHFKQVAAVLKNKAGDEAAVLAGFELAGEDKVFHPAEARIEGATNTVLVNSKRVPTPVAVRYAWRNNPTALTLANSAGLPLAPFRTDGW
jgi:sialate O-acetylesterase